MFQLKSYCTSTARSTVNLTSVSRREKTCAQNKDTSSLYSVNVPLYFMFSEIKKCSIFYFGAILNVSLLCNVVFKSARPLPYIATVITTNIHGQSLLRYGQENADSIRSFFRQCII